MVFSCRCFSFSFEEAIKHESRSQTKSASIETFYTAHSDLNASVPSSHSVTYTISEPTQRFDLQSITETPNNLTLFTFEELKAATSDFSTVIGAGGFGRVYKGVIKSLEDPFNEIKVAVKSEYSFGLERQKQWLAEVNFLGKVKHPNLIKLIGYCARDGVKRIHRLLVYEYMPNGSLENCLSGRSDVHLSWPMRLKVAVDSARGLAYLHEEMDEQIIFRDFKPSNVLLDEHWNAKLSDFGYARLGPVGIETHVVTGVAGTLGFIAPEYVTTGKLRYSTDVWSYGVFLLVLITGKTPSNPNLPIDERNLPQWVKPYLVGNRIERIVDYRIEGQYHLQSVKELSMIADKCLLKNHECRPKMSVVLDMLHELIMKSLLETIPRMVPILDIEGVNDGEKVTHEHQSATMVKAKGKRRFVCFPRIC